MLSKLLRDQRSSLGTKLHHKAFDVPWHGNIALTSTNITIPFITASRLHLWAQQQRLTLFIGVYATLFPSSLIGAYVLQSVAEQ